MDSKLLIVIAVVAVAAVGGGAYFLMQGGGSSDAFSPGAYPDTYLTVLGNADNDLDIDADDATAIQALIDSTDPYEYKNVYMYDANFDGVIDSKDVDKVNAIVASLASGDWTAVGKVHYVNVDKVIAHYDMTKGNKVITLIAPPLDSVLAMGGKELVVGFDSRIESTGKYYPEYAKTLDYSDPYLVGSCNDPRTEVITQAASDLGSINVVCGNQKTYGPTMESTFEGTNVQIIRIASWEYGETMYGFMTLGFLLKMNAGAAAFYAQYSALENDIKDFIENHVAADHKVGAAVAYGYDMDSNTVKLLGKGTGEYANLMQLDPYDSAEAYLNGAATGGHGNQINGEAVSAMYQSNQLKKLIFLIGTPFQVKTASGDAESTQAKIVEFYNHWESTFGLKDMTGLEYCIAGYSFSSGVSEVLNRLVLSYYLYTDDFIAWKGSNSAARTYIQEKVDWYCQYMDIDGIWGFNAADDHHLGMNLLYCGADDPRNIMNGAASGSVNVDTL